MVKEKETHQMRPCVGGSPTELYALTTHVGNGGSRGGEVEGFECF